MSNEEKRSHIMEIVDNHIIYFKFLKGNEVSSYAQGLQECKDNMENSNIDTIVVVVEDDEAMFNEEMQKIWLMTGDLADENNLLKWGVVVPSLAKQVVIEFLVQGGKDGDRDYEYLISTDEEDVISWAKLK